MRTATLHIDAPDGVREVTLEDELTIGRTPPAQIVIGDSGLSRKNTTIFREDDELLVVDEDSTNGTFLNGERISGAPRILRSGDVLTIGSSTKIRIEIDGAASAAVPPPVRAEAPPAPISTAQPAASAAHNAAGGNGAQTKMLIAAGALTFVIVFGALIALLVVSRNGGSGNAANSGAARPVLASGLIPKRVIDPLGGEDEDDLDDLIASWETEEKELDTTSVADIKADPAAVDDIDLNVTAAFLAAQERKSLEARNGETGIRPAGLDVPKELFGDGVIKQKAKLQQMKGTGYLQPMDFAELAEKRLKQELFEMPMATKSYYLVVGGSAGEGPFTSFSFQTGNAEIAPGSPKYKTLEQLAANFGGQKYDLNDPSHRKQMRIRLLRMFNKRAKPVLEEVANAYLEKFGRPLRVTSLTRSMDYQISLNATNANSFKVRGEGSLPPHTSGCAFDLARKHMTAEEQNFVMAKLAEMERANKLDALIEYGTNACWHIFIYFDGIPPRM
ncbi:MAG: FHA domain-containing protein [Pyrinomonadaceae bacterium]|nr:FHA domain-containing protein [Pyrinomonadaceae bacterium]